MRGINERRGITMSNKKDKVKDVNDALMRAGYFNRAHAELLKDGRIQYVTMENASTGAYKAKSSFNKMLSFMNGKDIRQLKAKYGKK